MRGISTGGHGPYSDPVRGKKPVYRYFGCKPNDLITKHHRYRFAFLDGCETALSKDLLFHFGVKESEFKNGVLLKDLFGTVSGPMHITDYPPTGEPKLRPGLFLAYVSDTLVARPIYPDVTKDDFTGCYFASYVPLCDWHKRFVGYWKDEVNYNFITAAKKASEEITSWDSQRGLVDRIEPWESGVTFKPEECLKVFGYGQLKFSEVNAENSSWGNP